MDRITVIIGIGGPMTSGKTFAAEYIEKHTSYPFIKAFADEIKRIAKYEFGWDGVKDDRGRRLLQLIGTEVGRAYNHNIWVEKLEEWYYDNHFDREDQTLIIPDCRFPNEVDFVRTHGGIAILLQASGLNVNGIVGHASETEMYEANWNTKLVNNKDNKFLDDLRKALIEFGVQWYDN